MGKDLWWLSLFCANAIGEQSELLITSILLLSHKANNLHVFILSNRAFNLSSVISLKDPVMAKYIKSSVSRYSCCVVLAYFRIPAGFSDGGVFYLE